MERLFMFKRLTGTMTDLSWPDTDVYVDDGSGGRSYQILSLYDESCSGHRGSDVFPFGLATDAGDPGFRAHTAIKGDQEGGNVLTNREILQALDPRVNKMSYIYDTFEWTHCAEDGIDMNDAWDAEVTGSKQPSTPTRPATRPAFEKGEDRYPLYHMFRKKADEVAAKRARAS